MKKLHFTYDMQIDYSTTVGNCNYTIKCVPSNTSRQVVENIKTNMYPDTNYQWGTDGFKNVQLWGKNVDNHTTFRFQIEGDATTGLADYEQLQDEDLAFVFSFPHGLNTAGDTIKDFYKNKIENRDDSTSDLAIYIASIVYDAMEYKPGSTGVDTSAEEAFLQASGVCQDYAHVMISLLHLAGIPARYVTGFIIGEGESHAWVEFLSDEKWIGIDPTNNKLVGDEYIKIAHGRDAKDCLINRGIIQGGGQHTQTVRVNVLEV